MGGGTVLDLGVYTIQVAQWALQQEPKTIRATGKLNEQGVDMAVEAQIDYGSGRTARIVTSALEQLRNSAIITGTKGTITVSYFAIKQIELFI